MIFTLFIIILSSVMFIHIFINFINELNPSYIDQNMLRFKKKKNIYIF